MKTSLGRLAVPIRLETVLGISVSQRLAIQTNGVMWCVSVDRKGPREDDLSQVTGTTRRVIKCGKASLKGG